MNTIAIAALVTAAAVGLVVWLVKWSAGQGEDRGEGKERARILAKAAKAKAKFDTIMAGPLGSKLDRLARIRQWRLTRKLRQAADRGDYDPAVPDDE